MNVRQVFFRTLGQLMVPVVAAVLVIVGATDPGSAAPSYEQAVLILALGSVGAVIGALAAVAWFQAAGAATSPLQKALRSLYEAIAQGLSAIVINSIQDLVDLPKLLLPLGVGAIGAAIYTFLQNSGPAPAPIGEGTPPTPT